MNMKKLDTCKTNALLAELLGKKAEQKKKCNPVVCVLTVVGILAAVAAIAYVVYHFLCPAHSEDDFEDYEDDSLEDDDVEYEDDAAETPNA